MRKVGCEVPLKQNVRAADIICFGCVQVFVLVAFHAVAGCDRISLPYSKAMLNARALKGFQLVV